MNKNRSIRLILLIAVYIILFIAVIAYYMSKMVAIFLYFGNIILTAS